ncbi:MAG: hypothetical protein R3Y15_06715, partial [Rikenellaceae bacterium]
MKVSYRDFLNAVYDNSPTQVYDNFFDKLYQQQQKLIENSKTDERIETPRGSFGVTNLSVQQMENAGYGLHHNS